MVCTVGDGFIRKVVTVFNKNIVISGKKKTLEKSFKPLMPKRSPFDEKNHLALDRVNL